MKKFACAALSTALLASMLAACGSSASTTPAASSADTSSDTGASSTEAAASTGAAADGSLHVAMNTDIQTMDVEETTVRRAFCCSSGMDSAPQLHMVERTLYSVVCTPSASGPAYGT